MTDNLPTTFNGSGENSGRTFLKCVDGRWSAKDGTELTPSTLLMCVGTDTAIQRFVDGKPETIYDKPLPNPDDLNAAIPQDTWEEGLDGNPRPPWAKIFIAFFVNPADAAAYVFSNSTFGARLAVGRLADRVQTMRALRGANVVPIVKLSSTLMPTKFGQKARPEFVVVEWRDLGGGGGEPAVIEHKPDDKPGTPVAPVSASEELNDSLPFDL
jgi:hypothetical protein